ncbi:MAG: AsmA family protein [Acidobacteriaceae bacterium]|nr:AsmA family protein [Acidobacteriaceae bacterium]
MSEPATGIAPAQRSPWHWILLLLLVILVIAFVLVPLININRYHRTVAESLGRSLGHPVHLGSVQLQVLPHTGLAVTDFVVEENPGFGAEPILRAPSVFVTLRLSSLWGGHIEPSRIDLENASVNLVRDSHGQGNFNSLLVQATHPDASTPAAHAPRRPPYIEFRSARINFKTGDEKRAFSFLNSDLSIWLEEPGQWRLRFEGQPARTDLELDLADTGLLRLDGSLNRATAPDGIPVKLHAEWGNAPLGQVSRMLFGEDSGWRGLLTAQVDLAGDLENLQVTTRLRVDNAHRQEFTPLKQLNIDAKCRAVYYRKLESLDDLTCLWPVGDGHLLLTGAVRSPAQPQANLAIEINHTPAELVLNVLGLLRRGVTPSFSASGLINGHFALTSGVFADNKRPSLSGEATVDSLALTFPGLDKPLTFPPVHLASADLVPSAHGKTAASRRASSSIRPAANTAVLLLPTPLSLGAPAPLELSGQLTASGFQVRAAGQADFVRLAALGRSSGLLGSSLAYIRAADIPSASPATVDLTFDGPWMTPLNSTAPLTTTIGSLRIQHAQAKFDWLPDPVEIVSATANFSPDQVSWTNAAITLNGIAARGSFSHPLSCPELEDCGLPGSEPPAGHFDLDVPTLHPAVLQSALMGAGHRNEFLNTILAQVGRRPAAWPALEGTIHVGSLALGTLVLHDAHGVMAIRGTRLAITSLEAGALGGSVKLSGTVETSSGRPVYSFNSNWSGVSVPQIAAIFHEKWGAGVVSGKASLTLEGYSAAALADSAQGSFDWDWTRGSIGSAAALAASAPAPAALREASLSTAQTQGFSPARFSHWKASGSIGSKALKLDSSAGNVTGTISFDRDLNLDWPTAEGGTLHIGGTLASPALEPAPPPVAP